MASAQEPRWAPVQPPVQGRSEQTMNAQPGSPPAAEIIPTHIHPSPFSCRQRLRKALFSQDTHPSWGGIARSPPQGALAATGRARRRHKHPAPGRDRQQTPVGEQAECHSPWVPLSPGSTERGFHWQPLLPQIPMDTLHFLSGPTP